VDSGSALWAPAGLAGCAEPVFCAAVGPNGQVCAEVLGHPGLHVEVGPDRTRVAGRRLPDRADGAGDVSAESPASAVTGYRLGDMDRLPDVSYLDYER
jgi:hypothetical protein